MWSENRKIIWNCLLKNFQSKEKCKNWKNRINWWRYVIKQLQRNHGFRFDSILFLLFSLSTLFSNFNFGKSDSFWLIKKPNSINCDVALRKVCFSVIIIIINFVLVQTGSKLRFFNTFSLLNLNILQQTGHFQINRFVCPINFLSSGVIKLDRKLSLLTV